MKEARYDAYLVEALFEAGMDYACDNIDRAEAQQHKQAVLDRFAELRRQLSEMQRIINEGH